ncbi:rhodanese-like domain-containing protein [Streptomyces sp. WAC05374]|uniref:rhodanese-like domain-containing protein n=1 Tax=Streptomyces sp. WAC05374 TaxID=2487420 RepID=UPI000F89BB5E|nr:rhodanese-like domain-containing protein [Streptomyces sp. WAC05374]RST17655.1 rhodanese-like domain-containing protein [Streptomyces sp. WAC05374]TDF54770.1 rhodanese-like domain-containing protein [Streptomyces sp. WAC05374]TDF56406.1 rhodanese-like domain-containing protein [Streptomyces sp. WAC05374]
MLFRRRPGRLSAVQAHQRTAHGQANLLDVRETHEWLAGHAPGALHVPLSRLRAGASLPQAAQGRPLIVICRSGNRSRQAVDVLADSGLEATDVTGGMIAWTADGLPVVDGHGGNGVVV